MLLSSLLSYCCLCIVQRSWKDSLCCVCYLSEQYYSFCSLVGVSHYYSHQLYFVNDFSMIRELVYTCMQVCIIFLARHDSMHDWYTYSVCLASVFAERYKY